MLFTSAAHSGFRATAQLSTRLAEQCAALHRTPLRTCIEWRLARIPSLESGIYAIGRMENQEQFLHEEDQAVRRILTDAKVFLMYQRQLNNLSIQEAGLRRQREKDLAELKRLQSERAAPSREMPRPFTNPAVQPVGFGFSSRLERLSQPIVCRDFGASTPPFGDLFSSDPPAEPSESALPDCQSVPEAA